MPKTDKHDTEERSIIPNQAEAGREKEIKRNGADSVPFREAQLIDINRIKPDPRQPRKTFFKESLKSLAESIKEIGGIIDPLTVAYDEQEDIFKIISGERRYRASKMVGLEKLPCIVKQVEDKKRYLIQLVANLQREDISPLEEAAGIKYLVTNFDYSQVTISKLLNKSKSYVSQILGLERLSQPARAIIQTSELSKEVQIQASRENDPEKQQNILKEAAEEQKTVKQVREEQKSAGLSNSENISEGHNSGGQTAKTILKINKFREWIWKSDDGKFSLTIRFSGVHDENKKIELIKASLKKALKYVSKLHLSGS